MKRIQKDIFFLQDSAAIVFKILPSESLQGTCVLRDYIELAGGICLDGDEDDPFSIPLVDVNFLHEKGMKSFRKSKNDQRDYFYPEFVYDSYKNDKIMDLNKYKIRGSTGATSAQQSSFQYDANQIARRELCWNDVIHQMSSKRAISNKKKESKKNRSKNQLIQSPQVEGTVAHLLPSQCDPPSSGGCGGEDPDSQIMHPSQNHSDDDNNNNNKENEFDEMEDNQRLNDINIDGDIPIKSIQDKCFPGRSDQVNSMPHDNEEDTLDEIRILESDAQVIQHTLADSQNMNIPADSQNINIILNNSNNNINEDKSVNDFSIEDYVVGNELPCTSKSVKRNNNEKESNNKTTPTKSLVDETPLDDDIDEEKINRKKRKRTSSTHHSSKKQKKSMYTSRSRSSSSSSASSQGKPENKSRRKSKSKQIINNSDDDDSSNSSDEQEHADSDYAPKKTLKKKVVKTERKRAYTYEESCAILSFINEYEYHDQVAGILVWRKIEELGKFGRTQQSMKEHFRKKIMKDLKYYKCSKENRVKFQKALESRQRRGRVTKLHSQDFKSMLDAEREKQEKKKKGKSKPQKQETDDDDD